MGETRETKEKKEITEVSVCDEKKVKSRVERWKTTGPGEERSPEVSNRECLRAKQIREGRKMPALAGSRYGYWRKVKK